MKPFNYELIRQKDIDFSHHEYEWVPHFLLRACQDIAKASGVRKFEGLYSIGEPVEAPEAYWDDEKGFWVINDGHRRTKALLNLESSGLVEVGNSKHVQNIIGGFFIKKIRLAPYTHPHNYVFSLEEIKEI